MSSSLPRNELQNINKSTGTFPPATGPIAAHSTLNDTKFVAPLEAHKKTPAINSVQLNAGHCPMKSLEMPQNEAPQDETRLICHGAKTGLCRPREFDLNGWLETPEALRCQLHV